MAKKTSPEEYKFKFEENVNGEYTLIDDYKNARTKIKVRHERCGNEYYIRPIDFITSKTKYRCLKCFSDKLIHTSKEEMYEYYKNKCNEMYNDEYSIKDILLKDDEYNGKTIKKSSVVVFHKNCGNEYCIEVYSFFNKECKCTNCCDYDRSFEYYIENNTDLNINDIWMYNDNNIEPKFISYKTNKKYYLKYYGVIKFISPNSYIVNYELKEKKTMRKSRKRKEKKLPEVSFSKYNSDRLNESNFLEKYWDFEKNTVNPHHIGKSTHSKVWIKCQEKDYHGSYEVYCGNFSKGSKCPYCNSFASGKTHYMDSLGFLFPDILNVWSEKNKRTPYEYSTKSNKKVWFKCEEGIHDDYISAIYNKTTHKTGCPMCKSSKGEKRIGIWLDKNNIKNIHDKEYFEDLLGINGGVLRPDFILPNLKVWIEYDGEFHYEALISKDDLKKNKEHDRRKNEYAKLHNWKMIRIPYWNFDNIEEILDKELKEVH